LVIVVIGIIDRFISPLIRMGTNNTIRFVQALIEKKKRLRICHAYSQSCLKKEKAVPGGTAIIQSFRVNNIFLA